MQGSKFICLELFGVNKRLNDIENIHSMLENQLEIKNNARTTNSNTLAYLYEFGYIIYQTYPAQKFITVDILSSFSEMHLSAFKKAILNIFKPRQHLYFDVPRVKGNVSSSDNNSSTSK